jgi:aryl-alcohol dehydrogenase-like predicted oxidoreductase
MRYVELVPSIRSSVLGFGCASIGGAVDVRTGLRAMHDAFELGVNHFDTAPSYGYGESEKRLGQFVKGRRERIVLATKFGIQVSTAARVTRPLKPIVRSLKSAIKSRASGPDPRLGAVSNLLSGMFKRVHIDGQTLTKSVHCSLRVLGTDYLDYVFLHEPEDRLSRIDDVLEAVTALKTGGQIRGFGISMSYAKARDHSEHLKLFDVLQFGVPTVPSEYEDLQASRSANRNLSLFAPFRGRSFEGQSAASEPADRLRTVLKDFPNSVVICSASSKEHWQTNASAVV